MRRAADAPFVVLALVHGAALVAAPSVLLVAIGVWWSSNTVAHNFIHRPFFRRAALNRGFSVYQSVLTGIPQTLWRERHLAHHAGLAWRPRWSAPLAAELALVGALWGWLAIAHPAFFAVTYVPGFLVGLTLCALHGHYEHAGATTTSHYGRLYNLLCFNDGYHVEHHASPGVHWSELPRRTTRGASASRWPAVLRWLDLATLEGLERLVLRSRALQRLVVAVHGRAFRSALVDAGPLRRIAIVGGGLFPRTALVVHDLAPAAELVIIDASVENLDAARRMIDEDASGLGAVVTFRHALFPSDDIARDVDLLVIPLAFRGDRRAIYDDPPAPMVIVHDWLWRPRGTSQVVSPWLLKRLNLVRR